MKLCIITFMLCVCTAFATDLDTVREAFKTAKDSKENTEQFYTLTKQFVDQEDIVLSAYHGVALTLKAAYATTRKEKIAYFKQGKQHIEAAITAQPNAIELRMIRLSVQSNAPKITRYHKHIKEDKAYLKQHINTVTSTTLKKLIQGFMDVNKVFKG